MRLDIRVTFETAKRSGSTLPISAPVFDEVMRELTERSPEVGGLLIGPRNNRFVTHFLLDQRGVSTPTSFSIDEVWLNKQMVSLRAAQLDIKGIVHSHPRGYPRPTEEDRLYLVRVLANPINKTEEFFFPIVCAGRMQAFIVYPSLVRSRRWATPAEVKLL